MIRSCLLAAFALLLSSGVVWAQESLSPERQDQIERFQSLLSQNRIAMLSGRVSYPLRRPNPIPAIQDADAFQLYYPILFDPDFRDQLISTEFTTDNTIERHGKIGLLSGLVWFDNRGFLIAVNYNSPQEQQLQTALLAESVDQVHTTVAPWKSEVKVCETDKFLIRVDKMPDGTLRYASWNKPKTVQDEPDLQLQNGKIEFQGTMGGVHYIFNNGNWSYQIQDVQMAEKEENTGWFLRLYKNEELQMSARCH